MTSPGALPYGSLNDLTAHLCVDMQNLFAENTPWHTPWMERVLPAVRALAEHRAQQTIFTRFIPPRRAEDRAGSWRRYYERWRDLTGERLDPGLLELLPPLAALAPPAVVIDKGVYSPFGESRLRNILGQRRVENLVVTGAETDVCVLATVMDAVDHGYRVVLAIDAICSSSDRTHDALMTLYRERFHEQIEIADTATILACWR